MDIVKYFEAPDHPIVTFSLVVVAAFLIVAWVMVLRLGARSRPNPSDKQHL